MRSIKLICDDDKRNIRELRQTLVNTLSLSSELLSVSSPLTLDQQVQVITETVQNVLDIALKQHVLNYHEEHAIYTIDQYLLKHPEQKNTAKISQAWKMACRQHIELARNMTH